eukprot:CAMPEP_0202377232 /NCGR_PEP_ID=MMETSP1127-20130417/8579_1 /ASSEMBLY_ACC=CAM_ASM_000462 /TAXON_ID=3047 /ORGANISM="Dunaliella tertiolecta, Strain CCMP1320" /LENGTH=70 /DNA_ID=CAMNT_0048975203 /DNA_START=587 /DNA_END=799 /DNA_ORIENTATION=-
MSVLYSLRISTRSYASSSTKFSCLATAFRRSARSGRSFSLSSMRISNFSSFSARGRAQYLISKDSRGLVW